MRNFVMRWGAIGSVMFLVGILGACAGEDAAEETAPAAAAPAAAAPAEAQTSGSSATKPTSTVAEEQFAVFPEDGMPQYGGQARLAGGNYKHLNIFDAIAGGYKHLGAQLYSTLVGWDWASGYTAFKKVGPELAKSWEVSADGTVWTFKLHENVKFHDGTPLTSADVKASLDHYRDPGDAAPPGASSVRPYVESVETPDAYTVVVNLKAPVATILQNLGNSWAPIAAKKDLDKGVDWFRTNANGTGAFKWQADKFEVGSSYAMERNSDYYKEGLPYLDSIQFFALGRGAPLIAAFETKKIEDVTPASLTQADEILERYSGQMNMVRARGTGTNFYVLNTEMPPFDNEKVRQAVYLWLDRQEFLDKGGKSKGYLADWVNGEIFEYGSTSAEIQKSNIAYKPDKTEARKRAKELLKEAGWSDLSGVKLRVAFRTNSRVTIAQIIAAQLKDMGFQTEVVVKEELGALLAMNKGDFNVGMSGFPSPFFGQPDYMFARGVSPTGQLHHSRIEDPDMQKRLSNIYNAVAPNKRKQLIDEMDQYLQTGKWPLAILYWTDTVVLRWNWYHGKKYQTTYDDPVDRVWLGSDAPGRQ
jgi:peptide/nickel transport system substrate-binding protein